MSRRPPIDYTEIDALISRLKASPDATVTRGEALRLIDALLTVRQRLYEYEIPTPTA